MTNTQEHAIIDDVKAGNQESYRVLVERYHRGLVQHLYNLMRNGQAAEDVAQEAFIRAYTKLHQYNQAYAFSTWLYKIADSIALRQLQQLHIHADIEDIEAVISDDHPSAGEIFDSQLTRQVVQAAVARLPDDYRQVIVLFYWDNCSYEDIAAIIDAPIGTVRTWLYRAKEQLRKELYGQV